MTLLVHQAFLVVLTMYFVHGPGSFFGEILFILFLLHSLSHEIPRQTLHLHARRSSIYIEFRAQNPRRPRVPSLFSDGIVLSNPFFFQVHTMDFVKPSI